MVFEEVYRCVQRSAHPAEGVIDALQQAASVLIYHLIARRQDLRLLHHEMPQTDWDNKSELPTNSVQVCFS